MERIHFTDQISIIPGSENPFSADVGMIEGEESIWLFDVGCNLEVAEYLQSIQKPKKVILSHFHPDHINNWNKISWQELYQGKNTYHYTKTGTIVEKEQVFFDGIEIHMFPIPSAHAKGSLGLLVGREYVFLGDAIYPAVKNGESVYNVQFLKEQIELLRKLPVSYCILSHKKKSRRKKEVVLTYLEKIYEKREKNNPYIRKKDEETLERMPKEAWDI